VSRGNRANGAPTGSQAPGSKYRDACGWGGSKNRMPPEGQTKKRRPDLKDGGPITTIGCRIKTGGADQNTGRPNISPRAPKRGREEVPQLIAFVFARLDGSWWPSCKANIHLFRFRSVTTSHQDGRRQKQSIGELLLCLSSVLLGIYWASRYFDPLPPFLSDIQLL
jgi:hypothetical protein